jgi:hypothetical protein
MAKYGVNIFQQDHVTLGLGRIFLINAGFDQASKSWQTISPSEIQTEWNDLAATTTS